MFVADLRPDVLHGLIDVVAHGPFAAAAADLVHKVADDRIALWRVDNLGVELQAKEPALAVFHRGKWRILSDGDRLETLGQLGELVAVRIPYLQRAGQFAEQLASAILHLERAFAIFPLEAALNFSAEIFCHQLQAETNAEHGHAKIKNLLVRQGCLAAVDTLWAAGKDDALGVQRGDLAHGSVVGQNCRENLALTNAARDDLRVL